MSETRRLRQALRGVNALLPFGVYSTLYHYVHTEKPYRIVEVGTAHGAATISMALALRDSGSIGHIWSIDAFEASKNLPSSRARFGDKDQNEAIVREHFRRVGVQECISLFVGSSELFDRSAILGKIDMLVLDADGRIDRDMLFFREFIQDDALIVIDDIDEQAKLIWSEGKSLTDLKSVIGNRLLEALVARGLLRIERLVGRTAFCRAQSPKDWNPVELQGIFLEVYRTIVFTAAPRYMTNSLRLGAVAIGRRIPLVRGLHGMAQRIIVRLKLAETNGR